MESPSYSIILACFFGLFNLVAECQPTIQDWKKEFQATDVEDEFCFGHYCNRSEEICEKKHFTCLHVFPTGSTDQEKTQLCLDLIDKGDKSVLTLPRSTDVCRYRFGKNRIPLGNNNGQECFLTQGTAIFLIILSLIFSAAAIGLSVFIALRHLKKRMRSRQSANERDGEAYMHLIERHGDRDGVANHESSSNNNRVQEEETQNNAETGNPDPNDERNDRVGELPQRLPQRQDPNESAEARGGDGDRETNQGNSSDNTGSQDVGPQKAPETHNPNLGKEGQELRKRISLSAPVTGQKL